MAGPYTFTIIILVKSEACKNFSSFHIDVLTEFAVFCFCCCCFFFSQTRPGNRHHGSILKIWLKVDHFLTQISRPTTEINCSHNIILLLKSSVYGLGGLVRTRQLNINSLKYVLQLIKNKKHEGTQYNSKFSYTQTIFHAKFPLSYTLSKYAFSQSACSTHYTWSIVSFPVTSIIHDVTRTLRLLPQLKKI